MTDVIAPQRARTAGRGAATATATAATVTATAVDADCCDAGALGTALTRAEADRLAALLKAVADPARLQILSLLRTSERQEACVCDLTAVLALSQPTVSHHLKVLTGAGLLTRERRGSWAWFTLVPERLRGISEILG